MDRQFVMKTEWSEKAKREMQRIFYYLEPLAGTRTARKVISGIYKRAKILERNPLAGQREDSLEDRPEGFRRLVEGNYKIIYYINGDTVRIAAVFDCRRDPVALSAAIPR